MTERIETTLTDRFAQSFTFAQEVRQMAKQKMTTAKFSVGQHVQHCANACGQFPAGCGVVESVTPWNTGDGYSYQVKCDKTGQTLPVNFKEDELTAD